VDPLFDGKHTYNTDRYVGNFEGTGAQNSSSGWRLAADGKKKNGKTKQHRLSLGAVNEVLVGASSF